VHASIIFPATLTARRTRYELASVEAQLNECSDEVYVATLGGEGGGERERERKVKTTNTIILKF